MSCAGSIRRWLWRSGIDIGRFDAPNHHLARRKKFLRDWSIDLILDVGANIGQYATELRKNLGYDGRIVSFEPMQEPWEKLRSRARSDSRWQTIQCGFGERTEVADIHISKNSISSSLRLMEYRHLEAAPESRYTGSEKVNIFRLDDVYDSYVGDAKRVWLKIDVQGSEQGVINGAENCLKDIAAIQVELSLQAMYHDEALIEDICSCLRKKDFVLVSLEPGFADPSTGELLQADGIFRRR